MSIMTEFNQINPIQNISYKMRIKLLTKKLKEITNSMKTIFFDK
jgi:hypothetical protein